MDIFKFFQERGLPPSPAEELLYEFVAMEIAVAPLRQGLWTKALTDSHWDEGKAKSIYVLMRVAQIKEELQARMEHQKAIPTESIAEARRGGLTEEDIAYLKKPIQAYFYRQKYKVTELRLEKAISIGKIRGARCKGVLWVQDMKIC